jgi:hypothetical protein
MSGRSGRIGAVRSRAWICDFVRHEALHHRVGWKDSTAGVSQQAGEAEGSLVRETPDRVGAALTTTGRVGTARRPGLA